VKLNIRQHRMFIDQKWSYIRVSFTDECGYLGSIEYPSWPRMPAAVKFVMMGWSDGAPGSRGSAFYGSYSSAYTSLPAARVELLDRIRVTITPDSELYPCLR
jgi:hypothetical protein